MMTAKINHAVRGQGQRGEVSQSELSWIMARPTGDGSANCGGCGDLIPTIKMNYKDVEVPINGYCEVCREEYGGKVYNPAMIAKAWRRAYIKDLLEEAGVSERYLNCSLSNFEGDRPETVPGYIHGPGPGKTHLAVGYLGAFIIEFGERAGLFVRAIDLSMEIQDVFREGSLMSEKDLLRKYVDNTPFLVLDDLGIEEVSDLVAQTFYAIIDSRYAKTLRTLITSRFTLAQHAEHHGSFGHRIASRIARMGQVLALDGEDRRRQK